MLILIIFYISSNIKKDIKMNKRNEHTMRTTKMRISSSIGRAPRFYAEISEPLPGPSNYTIREKSSNFIKFTRSKRTDLFAVQDSPSPGDYNIPSSFNKGKSFTFSPRLAKSTPKYPGPGQYDVKITEVISARPVFGKEKRKDNFLNLESLHVPGPGKYSQTGTLKGPQ